MRQPTEFEQRVYDALCKVPRGKVVTYAELGRAVGCRSAQAIGQAMKRNPFAPEVPCHRVVTSALNIGGYQGDTQGERVQKKLSLLEDEGVEFSEAGELLEQERVFEF